MQDRRRLFFINESDIPASAHTAVVGDTFNRIYFPIQPNGNSLIIDANLIDAPYHEYGSTYYSIISIENYIASNNVVNTMLKHANNSFKIYGDRIQYGNVNSGSVIIYPSSMKANASPTFSASEFLGYICISLEGTLRVLTYNAQYEGEYQVLIDTETT